MHLQGPNQERGVPQIQLQASWGPQQRRKQEPIKKKKIEMIQEKCWMLGEFYEVTTLGYLGSSPLST